MFSTLRNRLSIALGVMLIAVLGLAFLLFWGTQQTRAYLERGHFAHAQLQAYLSLSAETQRYFFQLSDWLTSASNRANQQDIPAPIHLQTTIKELRTLTERELAALADDQDQATEQEELQRIDRLGTLFANIASLVNETQARANEGLDPRNWQLFLQALEKTIDQDFNALIDAALADEEQEVIQVEQRGAALTEQLITVATIVSVVAVVLTMLFVSVLLRSIKHPIDKLVDSTTKLAAGQLGYRLAISGPAELQQLADSFNVMSMNLERQQQRLLNAQTELEDKVAERTHELHAANQELQHLDTTRRQFFADISHELRTPLTIILGEAEVTLRGKDKPITEYKTVLQRIVDLSQQLGLLVDDLLLLARSDSISARNDVKTLNLDKLLRQAYENAQALAERHKLSVSLGISDHDLYIRGDPQRFAQLLMIFIDNACRYSQPDQEIAISLEQDGSDAVITLSDNGIGIDAEDLKHIFERGYRGKQAQAISTGSGLGLPLAQSIVHAHNGSIELNSVAGSGTTVTVRLPLLKSTIIECAF